jgi:adenine/guanine phosphoribosyltransferase-like PRPP-binding protein
MAVEAYKGEAEVIGVKNFDAIGGVATAGLTFSSPLALALGRP